MAIAERYDCPTYPLEKIQALVKVGIFDTSKQAQNDIRALALTQLDIRKCICSLKEQCEADGGHFYKTMEAEHPIAKALGLWQDVYRVEYKHFVLYVKLQHPQGGRPVVVSFKEK